MKKLLLIFVLALLSQAARGQLPGNYQLQTDWLIDNSDFPARCEIDEDQGEIRLSNGLLRRTIRTRPDAATVGFDNLMTGETQRYPLDDNNSILLQVTVPAQSFDWYVITARQ